MGFGRYRFRRSFGQVNSQFRGARPSTYPNFQGLLDLYPGAAAAYSLRALSSGWLAGDVVEVRRSSDSTTQDFTASQITSGAMLDFVNTPVNKYTSDFSSGTNSWPASSNITISGDNDGISDGSTSKDDTLEIIGTTLAGQSYSSRDFGVLSGRTYRITGSFYAPSSNTNIDSVAIKDGQAGSTLASFPSGFIVSNGSWVDFDFTYTATVSGAQRVNICDSSEVSPSTNIDSNGDIGYIVNMQVNEVAFDGFVSTWYDQSGNANDATQITTTSQPKIVSAGSLVTGGLDFDGVDDYLDTGYSTGVTSAQSLFTVFKPALIDSNFRTPLDGRDANNDGIGFGIGTGFGLRFHVDTDDVFASFSTSLQLTTGIYGSSSSAIYQNGALADSIAAPATISGTTSNYMIGKSPAGDFTFNGKIGEIIIYPSDQTANRVGIETNINDAYSIYWDGSQKSLLDYYPSSSAAYSLRALNSAYVDPLVKVRRSSDSAERDIYANYDGSLDVGSLLSFCGVGDGFVSTWYDQSGNANDATQITTTAQPKIVDAGSLVTGGLNFDGVDDFFDSNPSLTQPVSIFGVYKALTNNSPITGASPSSLVVSRRSSGRYIMFSGTVLATGFHPSTEVLASCIFDGATSTGHWNGIEILSGDAGALSNLDYIGRNATSYLDGTMSEIIIYNFNQSANRVAIETNINDAYSIF